VNLLFLEGLKYRNQAQQTLGYVCTFYYHFDFRVSLQFELAGITVACLFKRKLKWTMILQL